MDVLENGSVLEPTNSFFSDVDDIRKIMENLSNDVMKLKAKQSNILAQPIVDDYEKVPEVLSQSQQFVNRIA